MMAMTNQGVLARRASAGLPDERAQSGGIKRRNKHQQRTDATRKALIQSARRIFARDGFEAARIEEIAASTGHTRGAFYAHFDSKEELFFALLEQEANRRLEEMRVIIECQPTPQGHLDALREFYTGRARDPQWVMLMLEFKLFAVRHPRMRARLAATHRRIRASLNLGAIDKLMPRGIQGAGETPESRKVTLEALLNGLVLERAYDPRRISKVRLTALLRALFDAILVC
jgi:AcrR family transcriptional regulator